MPRKRNAQHTEKQDRQADHIEMSYEERGVPKDEAERRAWATVNKLAHEGHKPGTGPDKPAKSRSDHSGPTKGGSPSKTNDRTAAAKKGWETRRNKASQKTEKSK